MLKESIAKIVSNKKNIVIGVLSIVLIGTMAHDISLSGQLRKNKNQVTQLEETIEESKSTVDRLEKENTNLTEQVEKKDKVVDELQKKETRYLFNASCFFLFYNFFIHSIDLLVIL